MWTLCKSLVLRVVLLAEIILVIYGTCALWIALFQVLGDVCFCGIPVFGQSLMYVVNIEMGSGCFFRTKSDLSRVSVMLIYYDLAFSISGSST